MTPKGQEIPYFCLQEQEHSLPSPEEPEGWWKGVCGANQQPVPQGWLEEAEGGIMREVKQADIQADRYRKRQGQIIAIFKEPMEVIQPVSMSHEQCLFGRP